MASLQLPGPISNLDWIDGHELETLVDDIDDLVRSVTFYYAGGGRSGIKTSNSLASKTRIHDLVVRNPGYQHHLIQLLGILFERFDAELKTAVGFTVDEAIAMSQAISDHVDDETGRLLAEAVAFVFYYFGP